MLERDIKYLNKVMGFGKYSLYQNYFCWLYPFTNENIKAYYSYLDFKNKSVLTVTSSGDHALNALLLGAKEVESFDVNPLAKYYSELKCAAVKTLSYEEFILFFYNRRGIIKDSKYYFNKNFYLKKIRKELIGDFKKFWDYFFGNFTQKDLLSSYLFTTDMLSLTSIINVNSYLGLNEYYQLKEILKDSSIKYRDINITRLDSLDKKYDIVVFSNVASYLDDIYSQDCLKYLKDIVNNLKKNDQTRFVICYLYSQNFDNKINSIDIYNSNCVRKYFKEDEYEYKSFDSPEFISFGKRKVRDKVILSKEKKLDK